MRALCAQFLNRYAPKKFLRTNTNLRCFSTLTKINTNVRQNKKVESIQRAVWEHLLPSTIVPSEIKTLEDWLPIRDTLLQAGQEITPISVDSIILTFCINLKDYRLAYNYFEFLKYNNIKLNLATLGKYFKVFYLSHSDQVVNEKEEEDIFKKYEEIRTTYSALDSLTCENLILALSLTKYWKEGDKLLDEIKITATPNALSYSTVVVAAFKNNDYNLAWNLLEEMIDKGRTPFHIIYLSYIGNCKALGSRAKFIQNLELLFDFFRENDVECNEEVAQKLIESCKEFKISANITNISNRGVCSLCHQRLQTFSLNDQDFQKLKQAIFEKVIVGKNVFYKTTPTELERFTSFLKDMKKYDVVVDGLNVAYSVGTKHSSYQLSKFVIAVVKHFTEQNQKVLVLGRSHMSNWPNWKQVTSNADTFLTHSLSQDDPYLLYCALYSGLNTIIISKDLMRSHLFRLKDPHLKIMFSHWLNQRQYQLRYINNLGKVFLKPPSPFLRSAQYINRCWHIPYSEEKENKWLCIQS